MLFTKRNENWAWFQVSKTRKHVDFLLQKAELLLNFCKNFSLVQQPDLLQDRFDSWVVKLLTLLFNKNNLHVFAAYFTVPLINAALFCACFNRRGVHGISKVLSRCSSLRSRRKVSLKEPVLIFFTSTAWTGPKYQNLEPSGEILATRKYIWVIGFKRDVTHELKW